MGLNLKPRAKERRGEKERTQDPTRLREADLGEVRAHDSFADCEMKSEVGKVKSKPSKSEYERV